MSTNRHSNAVIPAKAGTRRHSRESGNPIVIPAKAGTRVVVIPANSRNS